MYHIFVKKNCPEQVLFAEQPCYCTAHDRCVKQPGVVFSCWSMGYSLVLCCPQLAQFYRTVPWIMCSVMFQKTGQCLWREEWLTGDLACIVVMSVTEALDLFDLAVMGTAACSKDSEGQGARVCSRWGLLLCKKARTESAEGQPIGRKYKCALFALVCLQEASLKIGCAIIVVTNIYSLSVPPCSCSTGPVLIGDHPPWM